MIIFYTLLFVAFNQKIMDVRPKSYIISFYFQWLPDLPGP